MIGLCAHNTQTHETIFKNAIFKNKVNINNLNMDNVPTISDEKINLNLSFHL